MDTPAKSMKNLDNLISDYEEINGRKPIILINANTMRYIGIPIRRIDGIQYMWYRDYQVFIDSEKSFGEVELR